MHVGRCLTSRRYAVFHARSPWSARTSHWQARMGLFREPEHLLGELEELLVLAPLLLSQPQDVLPRRSDTTLLAFRNRSVCHSRPMVLGCVGCRAHPARVLPLSDGLAPRRFPFVNVALIVANFAV